MSRVIVLGSTGMLGSAVHRQLVTSGVEVTQASRTTGVRFDARELNFYDLLDGEGLKAGDYVVNCVGLTKARIRESDIESRALAVRLNVDFPNNLALTSAVKGVRVIQVATDCVFSGREGSYSESAQHDAEDVYGKTKSLGESPSNAVMHLRCSLIGPELGRNSLFFEWVRQQPYGASIQGFTNHIWNGLTSYEFGRIVSGVIREGLFTPGVQHLVPLDKVSKDQLVRLELNALGRNDVEVSSVEAPSNVDRTLETENTATNRDLFACAGFPNPPTVAQMVERLCFELAN